MNELFTELLVKKDKTMKDSLIKFGLIFLTVLFALAGLLINPLLLIGAVGLGVADFFILPKTSLEYEYLFINGEFDIDVIMSQQKRKRVFSFSLKECDICAPLKSHRMDYYNGNAMLKIMDFSSGNDEHKRFAVITRDDKGGSCKIILEPDENLANLMRNTAPSKVFLD